MAPNRDGNRGPQRGSTFPTFKGVDSDRLLDPGESEFSHGPGLRAPGGQRYNGVVLGQTVSEPESRESRRKIAQSAIGNRI
jgi:hypothetical protein